MTRDDIFAQIKSALVELFEVIVQFLMNLLVLFNGNSQGIQCIDQCGVKLCFVRRFSH